VVILELLLVILLALKLEEHLVVNMPSVAVLADNALHHGMVDKLVEADLMEIVD
jgi:hypothetical protein